MTRVPAWLRLSATAERRAWKLAAARKNLAAALAAERAAHAAWLSANTQAVQAIRARQP